MTNTVNADLPSWYARAVGELGVAEIPGARHNPRIVEYFRLAGWGKITDDETAWCAAFVSAMLKMSGTPSPNTVRALDFLRCGVPMQDPVTGCIAVFERGPGTGHVGFFVQWSDDGSKILVLGGNQANKVCYAWFPREKLIGFRWPQTVRYADEWQTETRVQARFLETPREAETRLRENGSRTIKEADRTEMSGAVVTGTGVTAILASIVSSITDVYNTLGPLAPLIGLGTLGLLAVGFGVYTILSQKKIKEARVMDDLDGLHLGRQ